jgi:hypothetical protein
VHDRFKTSSDHGRKDYRRQAVVQARHHKIDESAKLDRQAALLVVDQVNWPWRGLEGLETSCKRFSDTKSATW